MTAFECQVCGKPLFQPTLRLCRWRVARVEFVPNGSEGPVPVFMARCLRCKQHSPIPLAAMLAAARSQWDGERPRERVVGR